SAPHLPVAPRPRRRTALVVCAAVVLAGGMVATLAILRSSSHEEPGTPVAATLPAVPQVAQPPPPAAAPADAAHKTDAADATKQTIVAVIAAFPAWAKQHPAAVCPSATDVVGHDVRDAWNHALELTCTDQPGDQVIGVISVGADGQRRTADDIV